jgi:urease accessory protein
LDLLFVADREVTAVADLYQRTPLRALFPRPEPGDPLTAVLVNSSGGVIGGDRLEVNVRAGEEASALVTGQAAEKVYRSAGPEARAETTLTAEPGSVIEFLPQGTIVFDGSRFQRITTIEVSPGARALAGEVLTLGRVECGERFTNGLLHDEWRVRVGGRLVWVDSLHLSDADGRGVSSTLDSPAGFAGSPAYATFVYAADAAADHVELARDIQAAIPGGVRCGVTSFDGLLIARWLGANPSEVRGAFGEFWARFRAQACGLVERLPAIWNI